MASVFKKSYTRKNPETGKNELRYNSKWYIKYKDENGVWQCVPGFKDKSATYELAAKLERDAELARRGVVDPFEKYRKTPLAEHLQEFKLQLQDKGNSEKHVNLIFDRVKAVADSCTFTFTSDISASKVQSYLGKLRNNGLSIETRNHYLSAFKQFCRWLVSDRRVSESPVSHLRKENSKTDRRHDRRALSDDEFRRLIEAAETGSVVEAVSGKDRAMIYVLAAWTGYRRAELASLTLRSFDLTGENPSVRLQAIDSKNRKGGEIPLHPVVVERLQTWLSGRTVADRNALLFPLRTESGKHLRRTSKMMKRDLEAARKAWLKEAEKDKEEYDRRVASDFLAYCDEDGLFADFHANRHTFISNLGRAGVPLATAQKLARHSDPKLTASVYTHIDVKEQAAAVCGLPAPPLFAAATPQPTAYGLHDQGHVQTARETSPDMAAVGEVEDSTPSVGVAAKRPQFSRDGKTRPVMSCYDNAKGEQRSSFSSKPQVGGSSPPGRASHKPRFCKGFRLFLFQVS
ncbi:hypothetical protein DTL42_22005 [Bremerella cremea]|uniref:Uncharacterized protein n=1 Tax=Bremerella cremea TaxID=1031537 RepID=A0A368KML4_9BACT|nr:tyrosine-type recombinase/integrase [Bremerella cremea]RCS41245.1 hypothetical protein DTL42_22005 [Bremerella cremea]